MTPRIRSAHAVVLTTLPIWELEPSGTLLEKDCKKSERDTPLSDAPRLLKR